ncbi:MAG: S-layer homology domain-containing protein [Limnothrix sp. RL_2_0]|nr:S-layer homology domain-containing protein [Limnothrix sp. RL_2_0]
MSKTKRSKAQAALFLALTFGFGTTLPLTTSLLNPAPVVAQTSQFPDVASNYWAAGFINELVSREIIAGFPDGSFKPDAPVTRAQFAAMVQKALSKTKGRDAISFVDVSANYWAYTAITNSYQMGFLSGYPGQVFRPEQNIPREQVLVSLANGLNYSAMNNASTVLSYYSDASSISDFARPAIAAATERKMVVNYANLKQLNPKRNATRAEVAALIYQALFSQGQVAAINSQYIVTQQVAATPATSFRIPAGTAIPVNYTAEKILLTKDETVPVALMVSSDIVSSQGVVLIPKGSEVMGEFRPSGDGTQFIAQRLKLTDGRMIAINATSNVVTETESVGKGTNVGSLLKNAALGAGAAAAISAVTGDKAIATEELLIGAGAGILATLIPQFLGLNKVDLLVVKPDTNLDLTFNSDLTIQ